jgi:hypothetical protein
VNRASTDGTSIHVEWVHSVDGFPNDESIDLLSEGI